MYTKTQLDAHFYKAKGFYLFYIPVKVPYKKIYTLADQANVEKKAAFGPIMESGRMFGFGWIGVEVSKPSSTRDDVVHVSGEFNMHEHMGPYKSLGQAYKKIMKNHPKAKEYFNMYLDDPEKTKPEQCRTQILFR